MGRTAYFYRLYDRGQNLDTNNVWEVKRQDSVGDKIGVLISYGHDLPSPTRVEAKAESGEAREKLIQVNKKGDNYICYLQVSLAKDATYVVNL